MQRLVAKIFDSSKSMLIFTNGETLQHANKAFLDFFEFDTVAEFKKHYTCICDFFEEMEKYGYVYKNIQGKNWNKENKDWLQFILDGSKGNYKVLLKKKNEYFTFRIDATNIEDELYLVTLSDITELESYRNRLEDMVHEKTKELEKLNLELEQRIKDEIEKNREKDLMLFKQQRFAQMGEMISMIAHQWRQPLSNISTISGKLRLFLDLGKFDEKNFYISLEKIEEQTQYLSKTIDDFRHFFNPNKQKEMVCLTDVIQKSLDIIEKAITDHGVEVIKKFAFKTKAEIYPNELTHVLLSLISNARDVLLEKGIKQPVVEIYGEEFEDEYVIEIKDNGGGVPIDIQDSIFLPYFSTKSKKHGTGLGLYMAKMIIEQSLGGKISQYNSEDGAVFKIVLQKVAS